MSFENIGIGGILSFESRGAVANMTMAQRAFGALGRAASGVQASVARVGAGLGAFSLIGAGGLAAGIVGMKRLVSEGVAWNAQMQSSELAIGTVLAAVTKTPLDQNIALANKELQRLNVIAAQAPGETEDIINIFQMLSGPIIAAGGSMQQLESNTKSVAIMAGTLHLDFKQSAHAMSLLAGGTMRSSENLIRMLHSMNLLHESSQEWAALLPEQRLKRINEILSTFDASSERVGHTWEAQSSTFKSLIKIMAGAFTKSLFSSATNGLGKFNDAFFAHQDEWLGKIEQVGKVFGEVLGFIKNTAVQQFKAVLAYIERFRGMVEHLGMQIDMNVVKRIAKIGIGFVAATTALSPLITLVGFFGGKMMAVLNIARGLLGIVTAIGAPLLPVIAALTAIFLLFRREGETPMQTLGRAFKDIKEVGEQLWAGMQAGLDRLRNTWAIVSTTARKLWTDIQPGLEQFKAGMAGLWSFGQKVFMTIFNLVSRLVEGLAKMWAIIEPGVSAVFNAVMGFFHAVVDALNYLWPKIDAVLQPVFAALMRIGAVIAHVFNLAMQALAPVIEYTTWLWKHVLVPVAGFLVDVFGKQLSFVFNALADYMEVVWHVIEKIIDGFKWLADKASAAVSAVGDAVNYVFGGADFMGQALEKAQGKMTDTNVVIGQVIDNLHLQMTMAKLAAMGTLEIVQLVAKGLEELYNDTLKPIVDTGLQVLNSFVGNAEITAKQPDVNVDVNIKNNSTMCVNGRNLAVAQGQYETEVAERSGFNRTPWQTQRVQITGVKPA